MICKKKASAEVPRLDLQCNPNFINKSHDSNAYYFNMISHRQFYRAFLAFDRTVLLFIARDYYL